MASNYGCVYVIETKAGCKIGASRRGEARIKELRGQSPIRFERVHLGEECNNYFSNESLLHKMFKEKRLSREWFDVPFDEIVSAEKALHHQTRELQEAEDAETVKVGEVERTKRDMLDDMRCFTDFIDRNLGVMEGLKKAGRKLYSIDGIPYIIRDDSKRPQSVLSYELHQLAYYFSSGDDLLNELISRRENNVQ